MPRLSSAARLAAALLLTVLLAPAAFAVGHLVELDIVDRDSGEVLPVYRHEGRHYVAGRPGTRYAVAVRNRTGERVLTVVSVDGVNVVNGATASWHQSGYVLAPWQRYEIIGWRKSVKQVAAFDFTSLGDAYATRTGRPAQVGVIGVAVFREHRPEPPPLAPQWSESERREAPAAADAAGTTAARSAPAPAEKLGTGHGRRESSRVTHTGFERAQPQPDEVITLHYDSRENLVALGVIPSPHPAPPRPFPDSPDERLGFVPDPPRRR
ncbi:hypothetical protein M8A51_11755 [Schlegelella sp. S2-27]|uniref:Uncharacterized protein n=1 Tax=Caldimonas mangrovi TaxID=2944811 RepID=A0ABT0YPZ7_9BURK|nr:hypothetical protein [Caldimonas mangrovi]MCM5680206.1 hypothetical protein [Caldimonas mangrovi]